MHESFLRYRRFRWLKVSVVALAVSLAAYLHDPAGERRGGTPVGYTLGVASAALIVWLTWFGMRRRSYSAAGADLCGWLSAHVYLGALLLVLVPLHAAFQFDLNVHTFAYVLLAAASVSGLAGVVLYVTIPERMTRNRSGQKLGALLEQIGAVDAECKQLAATLPTAVARAVATSIEDTRIGGGVIRQLSGRAPRCPTTKALAVVRAHAERVAGDEVKLRERLGRLLERLAVKRAALDRVRRDVRLKALLDVWLLVHVPLALATVAAVTAHVFAVFYYR